MSAAGQFNRWAFQGMVRSLMKETAGFADDIGALPVDARNAITKEIVTMMAEELRRLLKPTQYAAISGFVMQLTLALEGIPDDADQGRPP